MNKNVLRYYPESRFGGFSDISGTLRFYTRVRALVERHFTVLDVGCGRGSFSENITDLVSDLRVYKGKAKAVIGIDIDPDAAANPFMDEFRLITSKQWPVESGTIDLIVSDWTVEHIEDIDAFFDECYRVLVPGGFLCFRTTNSMGYVSLISRLVPNSFHRKILNKAQGTRKEQDVFPTYYRCNSVNAVRKALALRHFDHCVYTHEAEPSYLSFSAIAFALGVLYQRIAPRGFGNSLFAFAQKHR